MNESSPAADKDLEFDKEQEIDDIFGNEDQEIENKKPEEAVDASLTAAEKETYDRIRSEAFGNNLEAAIEEKGDPTEVRPHRKAGVLSEAEQRMLVKRAIEYVHRMDEAYIKDLEAFSNGEQRTNCLRMIRDVERQMANIDFAKCCLSCKLIPVLANWIRPGAHGDLGINTVRSTIYRILLKLPIKKSNVKEGNMGELLVKLWMNKKENHENHILLHQIIEKWLRLVTGMSDTFEEEANDGMEDIAAAKKDYLTAVNRRRDRGFTDEQEERSIFAMMPKGELKAYVNDARPIPIRQEPKGKVDSGYNVLMKMNNNPRKRAR